MAWEQMVGKPAQASVAKEPIRKNGCSSLGDGGGIRAFARGPVAASKKNRASRLPFDLGWKGWRGFGAGWAAGGICFRPPMQRRRPVGKKEKTLGMTSEAFYLETREI